MTDYSQLIDTLRRLDTESVNPDTVEIDSLSAVEICQKINAEDAKVAAVVARAIPQIAKAAEIFAETIRIGRRVIYVGAGTSGRLGVLDSAECPPTFGTDPDQIIGLISGGYETLILSKEGVEDQEEQAKIDLSHRKLSAKDFVVGIAASARTPYTLSAVNHAMAMGCKTALIICNKGTASLPAVDILIELPVGPEAITGSTRMKSGTAQKLTLNMISTCAMVLLGKTYGNLMVDLQAKSEKLAARSRRILIDLLGIDITEASALLGKADGSVKTALVMYKLECTPDEARRKIREADGFLSKIL
ncbi:MAG: N-acetylmuramic acid 6-phosphate etherase [Candidatus Zixiibacteriota bacterium]